MIIGIIAAVVCSGKMGSGGKDKKVPFHYQSYEFHISRASHFKNHRIYAYIGCKAI